MADSAVRHVSLLDRNLKLMNNMVRVRANTSGAVDITKEESDA